MKAVHYPFCLFFDPTPQARTRDEKVIQKHSINEKFIGVKDYYSVANTITSLTLSQE